MKCRADPTISMGVSERPFYVTRGDEKIPGILWAPEQISQRVPLVLVGHGGKSEKRNPFDLALARRFVRRHGIAVCAIDAIDHGERGPIIDTGDGPAQPEFLELWKRADTFDRMNADWISTLDGLLALGIVDPGAIGYWGLSMGTILGLPFVAAGPRISAAVLGACGARGWTLGIAESLTGGLIGARLTNVPGSSAVFRGSIASYATEVKRSVLGVTAEHVVSEECAQQMAEAACRVLGADVGIGIMGVAGPDEQEGQPPGTVFYALAVPEHETEVVSAKLPFDRERIRQFSTITVLNLLRMRLASLP